MLIMVLRPTWEVGSYETQAYTVTQCRQYGTSTPYCVIMSSERRISQKRDVLPTAPERSNFAPEHLASYALAKHLAPRKMSVAAVQC